MSRRTEGTFRGTPGFSLESPSTTDVSARARAEQQAWRAKHLPKRTPAERAADLRIMQQWQRIGEASPFHAADFARRHRTELESASYVMDADRAAAGQGEPVTIDRVIMALEGGPTGNAA